MRQLISTKCGDNGFTKFAQKLVTSKLKMPLITWDQSNSI